MATEKSTAIVLRVVEFSETSCIVTLYTRDFGKITGLAKGARRRKGPFDSALDLLSVVSLGFIHKTTDTLDLLTEAKLERRFRSADTSLERLNCAFYLIEILNSFTEVADPNPQLFDQAEWALRRIDGTLESPFSVLAEFELNLLAMLGHSPMIDACVGCGESMDRELRNYFGTLAGGLYCSTCRVGKKSVISLSPAGWKLLDEFRQQPLDSPQIRERGEPFGIGERNQVALGEVRQVLNLFISNLLGNRPRLQPFLKIPISDNIPRTVGSTDFPG